MASEWGKWKPVKRPGMRGAAGGGGVRRRMEPTVPGLGLEGAAEWPSLSDPVSIEPKIK